MIAITKFQLDLLSGVGIPLFIAIFNAVWTNRKPTDGSIDDDRKAGNSRVYLIVFFIIICALTTIAFSYAKGAYDPPSPLQALTENDKSWYVGSIDASERKSDHLSHLTFKEIRRIYFVRDHDLFQIEKFKGFVKDGQAGKLYPFPTMTQIEGSPDDRQVLYYDLKNQKEINEETQEVTPLKGTNGHFLDHILQIPYEFEFIRIVKLPKTMRCPGVLDIVMIANNVYKGGFSNSSLEIYFDSPIQEGGLFAPQKTYTGDLDLPELVLPMTKLEGPDLLEGISHGKSLISNYQAGQEFVGNLFNFPWTEGYRIEFPSIHERLTSFHFVRKPKDA